MLDLTPLVDRYRWQVRASVDGQPWTPLCSHRWRFTAYLHAVRLIFTDAGNVSYVVVEQDRGGAR